MSKAIERQIITKALKHPGLLTADELKFVVTISKWPEHWKLSPGRLNKLVRIGRFKLLMDFPDPEPVPVIDYRARACA